MFRILALFLCVLCISLTFAQENGKNLVEITAANPELSLFAAALAQTQWGATLEGDGPFTVFAPTDDAFATALERIDFSQELLFSDTARLSSLISFHILDGALSLAELGERSSVMPLRKTSLVISIDEGRLLLNEEALVLQGDLEAANGRLHIVNAVLLAPGEFAVAEADNLLYLVFGIIVVTIIMVTYLGSMVWRWRMVQRERAAILLRLSEGTDLD